MQQFCLSPFSNLLYTLIQKYLAGREDKQGKNKQCSREKREFFFWRYNIYMNQRSCDGSSNCGVKLKQNKLHSLSALPLNIN